MRDHFETAVFHGLVMGVALWLAIEASQAIYSFITGASP